MVGLQGGAVVLFVAILPAGVADEQKQKGLELASAMLAHAPSSPPATRPRQEGFKPAAARAALTFALNQKANPV
jgi:hypothetical protein